MMNIRRFLIAAGAAVFAASMAASVLKDLPVRDVGRNVVGLARDFPWLTDFYGFDRAVPESHGLDGVKIKNLSDDLMRQGSKSFLILSDGKMIHERYGKYHGARAQHYGASLAKALVGGLAALLAVDDGLIHLDAPAWRYLPDWRGDPRRAAILVRDLLNHSSGLANPPVERNTAAGGASWEEVWWANPAERFELALSAVPVQFAPGTRIEYSNPGFVVFSYLLARSLLDAPVADIYELLRGRLKRPLGIPDAHWRISYGGPVRKDGLNLYHFEGGVRYTARAVARLGELIVGSGQFNGQSLISAARTDSLVTGRLATPGARRPPWLPLPVLGWWSNADGTWPNLPRDTLVGAGAEHQIVIVIQSRKLVVVRQGAPLGGAGWGRDYWQSLDQRLLTPLAEILRT